LQKATRPAARALLLLLLTNNVTEAFEMLACHEVGVALCDQRMPEMPRVEFLSKIRKMYPDTVRMQTSARELGRDTGGH
jgi:DNA-binding NarL/FixJ family response regulator